MTRTSTPSRGKTGNEEKRAMTRRYGDGGCEGQNSQYAGMACWVMGGTVSVDNSGHSKGSKDVLGPWTQYQWERV